MKRLDLKLDQTKLPIFSIGTFSIILCFKLLRKIVRQVNINRELY